ncbi:hypothetical protein BH11PSE8_BH11PSE8_04410 [soil metagenome]
MNNDLNRITQTLHKNQLLRLHKGEARRIEVATGTLWITLDNDPRDIVLDPGQGFGIAENDHVLLSAIDEASFALLQ